MIPLLLIALLLSGAWFSAPIWLSKAAEYFLNEQQCSEAVLDIETVGWNSSQIKRLYCKNREGTLEFDLTDAVIHYSVSELLEKRITHIKLDSIAIQLRPSLQSAPKAAVPLLTTPALILEALPVSSFEISNISLQRQNSDGEILQQLSGKASYSDQGLSLELHEDSYLQGLRVSVDLDKKNGIRTTIQQGEISIIKADSTMHKTADGISIEGIADIELAPFSKALKPWLDMPDMQLKGRLHSIWQVSLPLQSNQPLLQQLNISSTINLDFALSRPHLGRSQSPSQGHVNLGLTYKQGLGTWLIDEQSLLSFGDKQKSTVDISKLSGSFSFAESGWSASIAEKSELHLKNIHIDDIFIPKLKIKTSTPVAFAGDAKGGIRLVNKAAVVVTLPVLKRHKHSNIKGLRINLDLNESNRISAAVYQGRALILKTNATMQRTDDSISAEGDADFKLGPFSVLLKPWFSLPKYKVAGELHSAWQLSLPVQRKAAGKTLLEQLNATASLKLNAILKAPNAAPSRGKVNLNLKYNQGVGSWVFGERSQLEFDQKNIVTLKLSKLSGSFRQTEPGWSIAIAKNSYLQVSNILSDGIAIPHVQIKTASPIEIMLSPKKDVNMVKVARLSAAMPSMQWQENSLFSREIKLSIDRGNILSPSGSFAISAISFASPTVRLPESNVSGSYRLSSKRVSLTGSLDAQQAGIHFNWQLKHHLARQNGMLDFAFKPLLFGEAGIDLSRIIDSQDEYAIDSGAVDFVGQLKWHKGEKNEPLKLESMLNLGLSNLKGHYKTNQFAGLSGKLLITGDEKKLTVAPTVVSLDTLSAGVPIHNISMHAALSYPLQGLAAIEINQFKAETLGGVISSEHVSIDLARASNPFLLRLEHMDAGQIANIRQQEGLYVKGFLDGSLPFDWGSEGLKMTTGALESSTAGGLIRYLGTEYVRRLAATDHATKMVLDIMNDFYYKQLKIGADYMPDGELKLSIHLKGNNPGYEKGRAVEFNFNIEENILKLLQGLRMAGAVSGALEKKVQKTLQSE